MVLEKQPHLDREMVTPPPLIDEVTTEDKENSSSVRVLDQLKGEKPKKKSAMFADTVEVLSLFVKTRKYLPCMLRNVS